jgi:hypothetical protein
MRSSPQEAEDALLSMRMQDVVACLLRAVKHPAFSPAGTSRARVSACLTLISGPYTDECPDRCCFSFLASHAKQPVALQATEGHAEASGQTSPA